MSKFKRPPSFHWPQGWFMRQVPYCLKEFEVRFNAKYVATLREEVAETTFTWLQTQFPTGLKLVKEEVEPEWE